MKKIVIGIIAVVLIGVGGTVAALYTHTWNPMWNPFRPDPEVVVKEMATKMNGLDAVHSDVRIDIGARGEENRNIMSALINLSTDSDNTDQDNPKSKGSFEVDLSTEGVTISGSGEMISVGQVSYFKINELPNLGNTSPMMSEMLGMVRGKWIRVSQEDLEVISDQLGQNYQSLPEGKQEEILNKVKNLLEGKDLYNVKEELKDEEINGKMAYNYLLELDQEAMKEFVPELIEVLASDYLQGQEPSEGELEGMREEVSSSLDKFFEKVGNLELEIWVGQKDYYLYKAKFEKTISSEKVAELLNSQQTEEGNFIVLTEIDFSNFNDPVAISEPEDYQSISKLIQTMQMIIMQSMFENYNQ